MRLLLMFLAVLGLSPALANDRPCAVDNPCEVDGGDYLLGFPEDWDNRSPLPAIVYFHGHNSSARSVVNSAGLRDAFRARGYLVIAPNGAPLPGRTTRAWPARPQSGNRRDDIAFTLRVLDDVAKRLPLAGEKLFAAGFSAGGSMAWMLACYAPDRFAGFVSISGALRRPIPDAACPGGPARMLHIHGFADRQVPLEGRGIRDWHQGDVFESLNLLRTTNQCRSNPHEIVAQGTYRCRIWNRCTTGEVQFCMHDGGHMIPKGWAHRARDWLENGSGGS